MEESALVRDIVEIAGKKRIEAARVEGREEGRDLGREEGRVLGREEGRDLGREEGRDEGQRLGLANLIVRHAHRRSLAIPFSEEETAAWLAAHADPETLMEMGDRISEMDDFEGFLAKFGLKNKTANG
jgi:hypothetical protein